VAKRRSYRRRAPVRTYRKLYIIATEGAETEPAYFAIFQNKDRTIRIRLLDGKNKSAPKKVLKLAEKYIQKQKLKKNDEV